MAQAEVHGQKAIGRGVWAGQREGRMRVFQGREGQAGLPSPEQHGVNEIGLLGSEPPI